MRPLTNRYPSWRYLRLNYGSSGGLNDQIRRISALIDDDNSTHLADYSYLGFDRTVEVGYAASGFKMTYLKQTGDGTLPSNIDPGDKYTGIDRMQRVWDMRWIRNSDSSHLERVQYGFDLAGNRLFRDNLVASGTAKQDELYTYDRVAELTVLKRGELNSTQNGLTGTPSWEEDFTLDDTANIVGWNTKTNNAASLTQTRTNNKANEITNITSSTPPTPAPSWTTPAYDLAGNATSVPQPATPGSSYALKYDAWNRLVQVSAGGTTIATYKHDGMHRRIAKVIGSATRHYYYSRSWQILEEKVESGGSTRLDRQFVWGLRYRDDLILRDRDTNSDGTLDERLYTCHDYFNATTAVQIVSGTPQVQERFGYDAYGWPRLMDSSFAARSGSSYDWETLYGAYRWDSESGLFQVRSRYLHSPMGVWPNRDPIQEPGGVNLYTYVFNDPVNEVDPLGLELGDWYDPRTYWNEGFLEGWSKGGQGVINAFTGGLFWPEYGLFYGTFDNQWKDLGTDGTKDDSAFNFGNNSGRVAVACLAGAGALSRTAIGNANIGWKGGEITFTRPGAPTPDWRINPFGGSDYPPHYHRRGPGGMGRHRPWQPGKGGRF